MRGNDLDVLLDGGLDEAAASRARVHLGSLCVLIERNAAVPHPSQHKRQAQTNTSKYYRFDALLDYLANTNCEFVTVSGGGLKLFLGESPEKDKKEIDSFNDFFDYLTQSPAADICFQTRETPPDNSDTGHPLSHVAQVFEGLGALISRLDGPPDCQGHEVLLRLPGLTSAASPLSFQDSSLELFLSSCRASSRWSEGLLESTPSTDVNGHDIYPATGSICDETDTTQEIGVRLYFVVSSDNISVRCSDDEERYPGKQPSQTLKKLLEKGAFNPWIFGYDGTRFTETEKLVLAATLVSSLTLSLAFGRFIKCWDPETIYFLADPSGECVRNTPYALCKYPSPRPTNEVRTSPIEPPEPDIALEDASFQLLTKLLLEIKCGFRRDETPSVDAIDREIYKNIGNGPYLKAVRDCLVFRKIYQRHIRLKANRRQKFDPIAAAREVISPIINSIHPQKQRATQKKRPRDNEEEHQYPISSEYGQLGISGGSKVNNCQRTDDLAPANPNGKTSTKKAKVRFELDQNEECPVSRIVFKSKALENSPAQPADRRGFEIAIICALPLEANAVESLFDTRWDADRDVYGKASTDPNAYSIGIIGHHNVVLVHIPGMGNITAASAAAHCRSSFERIKLGFVVGVCGGVPFPKDREEIVLGDVVISLGIIQHDLKRQYPDKSVRKQSMLDALGRNNAEIRSLLSKLQVQGNRKRLQERTAHYLSTLKGEFRELASYPGALEDKLFEPHYRHKHQTPSECQICGKHNRISDPVCETAVQLSCNDLGCDRGKRVPRTRLDNTGRAGAHISAIHFGLIASGDTVMKSGFERDEIAANEGVIAFEMEGAGVWDNLPCLVTKGVCDYADSHKSKKWQNYAAATAAACTKAFLEHWPRPTRAAVS
ncbi:hypothetical protein TWF679_007000 [Orbilia oligospora]|uniref:Nucleoside phosphorylase domain-containing protein n=1 Tax=Orbilia oligospora TaxID=2813651 RepID=A0A8H8VKY7_ORBOL|nr:hypothetical protein TWF679_007000 [Orbilia oligospora]